MKRLENRVGVAWAVLMLLGSIVTVSAYYDPGVQRWINRDPVEESDSVNLYRSFGHDPVGSCDPLGLVRTDPWDYPKPKPPPEPSQSGGIEWFFHELDLCMDSIRIYRCQKLGEIGAPNSHWRDCVYLCLDQFGGMHVIRINRWALLPCFMYEIFIGFPD